VEFIVRDYVQSWYGKISDDKDFTRSVRDTAQKIAINVANQYVKIFFIIISLADCIRIDIFYTPELFVFINLFESIYSFIYICFNHVTHVILTILIIMKTLA